MPDTLGALLTWTVTAPLGVMPAPDPAGDTLGDPITLSVLMVAPLAPPANADLGGDVLAWLFFMPAGDIPDEAPAIETDTTPFGWSFDMLDGDVPGDAL